MTKNGHVDKLFVGETEEIMTPRSWRQCQARGPQNPLSNVTCDLNFDPRTHAEF